MYQIKVINFEQEITFGKKLKEIFKKHLNFSFSIRCIFMEKRIGCTFRCFL